MALRAAGDVARVSDEVTVRKLDEHVYAVRVTQGATRTDHRVTVDERLRDDLALDAVEADEEQLVREAFAFLLKREPGTSIYSEFDLGVTRENFEDFLPSMRDRLGLPG